MILRRAEDLSTEDNVRLGERPWNIDRIEVGDHVVIRLRRAVGDEMTLSLLPNDMVLLA